MIHRMGIHQRRFGVSAGMLGTGSGEPSGETAGSGDPAFIRRVKGSKTLNCMARRLYYRNTTAGASSIRSIPATYFLSRMMRARADQIAAFQRSIRRISFPKSQTRRKVDCNLFDY
jgi:hypothetical protein